ncbi:MAG: DinB family protein [Actinomycetota bacterium]
MKAQDELLEAENAAWSALCARVDRITDDLWWTRPGVSGPWSPKDVLAHIACWHAEAVRHLEAVRTIGADPSWPEVETFNDVAYGRCADLSPREVLAMSGSARHRWREEVAAAPPIALTPRMLEALAECGHQHYHEHLAGLDAFLESP